MESYESQVVGGNEQKTWMCFTATKRMEGEHLDGFTEEDFAVNLPAIVNHHGDEENRGQCSGSNFPLGVSHWCFN
jgi:hypothetical protein